MKFKGGGSGPLMLFCRLKGEGGRVREVPAVLEPSFDACIILRGDAVQLGYGSVTYRPEDWQDTNPTEVSYITSIKGVELGTWVKLKEVSIGELRVENVDAVVTKMEFPGMIYAAAFLGRSFLKHFKLEVDPKSNTFSLT
jgi:hypothetical protein